MSGGNVSAGARADWRSAVSGWMGDDERRLSILKAIVAFSVVSTTLHYTHNFVAIDRYPADLVPGPVTQVAIIVSWPLFTAIGLYGYRLYSERRYSTAHVCLLVYSMLGITTVGHFLDGSPDIAAFWYGTIFTDFLAGTALVVFTAASALVVRPKDGGLDAGDRVG